MTIESAIMVKSTKKLSVKGSRRACACIKGSYVDRGVRLDHALPAAVDHLLRRAVLFVIDGASTDLALTIA